MNKLLKIGTVLFFLIPLLTNSQEILKVDFGNEYLNFREMSFREFAKNQYSYKSPKSRMIRERFGHDEIIYLNTPFLGSLRTNRILQNEYEKEILKLKENFSKSMHGKGSYWGQFEGGSKKAYDYLMLNLEKFEIISEHYKELYNLDLIVVKEKNEIIEQNENLELEYSKLISDYKDEIFDNDVELNNLKNDATKEIGKIELFFKKKEESIGKEIKSKIDKLGSANYNYNKKVIINDYKPIILNIVGRKRDSLSNVENFWNDKVNSKNSDLNTIVNKKTSLLEKEKIEKKDSIRKTVKLKYDIRTKEGLIFDMYDKKINEINMKIKNSL